MSDYAAGRAYEAAHQTYRSRLRNHEPKPPNLAGIDAETFGVVRNICEKLLATGAEPMQGLPEGNTKPIMIEKLVSICANYSVPLNDTQNSPDAGDICNSFVTTSDKPETELESSITSR